MCCAHSYQWMEFVIFPVRVWGYCREAQTSLNQQLRFQIRLLSLRLWLWELVWLTPEGLSLKSSCLGLSCSVLLSFLKLSHGTLQQLPRDPRCVISLFFIWEHLVSTPVQTRLVRQEFTPGKGGGLFFRDPPFVKNGSRDLTSPIPQALQEGRVRFQHVKNINCPTP